MEINGTLIVQGINFFIVYVILRLFFFKPIVASIHQEDKELETLQGAIEARTSSVLNKEREIREQWQAFQQSYASTIPHPQQEIVWHDMSYKSAPLPDQASIDKLSTQVATKLVEKVLHDRA